MPKGHPRGCWDHRGEGGAHGAREAAHVKRGLPEDERPQQVAWQTTGVGEQREVRVLEAAEDVPEGEQRAWLEAVEGGAQEARGVSGAARRGPRPRTGGGAWPARRGRGRRTSLTVPRTLAG